MTTKGVQDKKYQYLLLFQLIYDQSIYEGQTDKNNKNYFLVLASPG